MEIEGKVETPPNQIVTWADKMKVYAQEAVKNEQPQGQFFSIKAGVLSFGGIPIPNNVMDTIVVGTLHENVFYKGRYDSQNPQGPVCFAFSHTGADMRPHEASVRQQAESCKVCPNNAWGSDPDGGRGKACKNVRRVCLMSAGVLKGKPDDVKGAQSGYLRIPVTSVASYQKLIASIGARGLPPFGMVVRVKVVPDAKTQVRVEFEPLQPITDQAFLQQLMERFEIEQKLIDFPYETIEPEANAQGSHQTKPAEAPAPQASKF
jgi:hypothetical protein